MRTPVSPAMSFSFLPRYAARNGGRMRRVGIEARAEDVADPGLDDEVVVPLIGAEDGLREASGKPGPAGRRVEHRRVRVDCGEMGNIIGTQTDARPGQADPLNPAILLVGQDIGRPDGTYVVGTSLSTGSRRLSQQRISRGLSVVLRGKTLPDCFDECHGSSVRSGDGIALRRLVDQLGDAIDSLDCLGLRDDALLYKQVQKALAEHRGDSAMRVRLVSR